MKTIQYNAFGHADVLHIAQAEKPVPKENEVLIKIIATTVNPGVSSRTGWGSSGHGFSRRSEWESDSGAVNFPL